MKWNTASGYWRPEQLPTFIVKAKAGRLTGQDFRYMMVFENNPIDGAERLSDALTKLRRL